MSLAKDRKYITGSMGDNIDQFPITREEPSDADLIVKEWNKGKIHTKYTDEELKRMLIKLEDYKYVLNIPVKDITDETISFTIQIVPTLFDVTQQEQQQQEEEIEEEDLK